MGERSVSFFGRLVNSVRIRYSRYVQEHDYAPAFRNANVALIGSNCQLDAVITPPYTPLFYTNPGDDRIAYP